jgi:hypothetical protein
VGQVDAENRALARFAGHLDEALVLLHNAVYRGQAQAGALAGGLGGEKGLKQVF